MKAGEAKVGMAVWVHAMGSYYAGNVIRVTDKGAEIEYTSGANKTRQKWLPSSTGIYAEKYTQQFPLVAMVEGELKPLGARVRKDYKVRRALTAKLEHSLAAAVQAMREDLGEGASFEITLEHCAALFEVSEPALRHEWNLREGDCK